MASGNTSNKTALYTYKAADGTTTVTLWSDGTETLSNPAAGYFSPTVVLGGNQSQTLYDTTTGKSGGTGTTTNDIIYGNNAGDTIDGSKASGNDFYFGGNGNDYLDGNNGVDVLVGGTNAANTTMLVGGTGGDILIDGAAKDTFLYRATTESSYVQGGPIAGVTTSTATDSKIATNAWDIIVNFDSTKDTIDLSLLDKQLSGSGPTKLVWLGSA